jgi:N-acetylmuramoyl-L-alanine amidase
MSDSNKIPNVELEACQEIHEAESRGAKARSGFNGLIQDAPSGAGTVIVNALSQQLIYQINLIVPNALVSFDDLNVELGDAAFPFVPPAGKEALRKAIEKRGVKMVVNSAYRTLAQQMLLYNDRHNNGNPVAAPGRSNHQSGLALDIEDRDGWEDYLSPLGWEPLAGDPPHVDYQGSGARDLRGTTILAFQQLWNKNHPNNKIDEDGDFGPATEAALNKSPSTGFAIAPWRDKPRVLRLSRPLTEGADVIKLQEKLKAAGMAITVADGVFGPGTDKAVKALQTKNNLVADGTVGPVTMKLFA